ncbi:transposase family protein [Acinetobacter pseudolwoffii]|uniref:transposase family protein n=1 Tax=Acinetobacter pseudolwoffii TaxID=2053287 RepID=UPI000944FBB9|nr:transposase family protein [Acinetobacter pseudolwoffii]
MKYQKLNRFSDSEFKRLVGVPRPVFSEMVEVLKEAESLKKKSGRPHTLAIEDQLLLTLNYLRNYSTQLELAANYHIAESNVNRTHCDYVMTDLGYYGLEQDGFKLLMPIKKKKNFPLFDAEKNYNKMIGKIRVVIEHINSQLKRFRILSERYRNRRKRFGLRINLIAALVNRMNLQ